MQANTYMSLKHIDIRNFKGIEKFGLNTDGIDAYVYGDNGTGKTTIMDSVSWLLFDKDSSGQSKFEIKPLDSNGKHKNKVETEVKGVFVNDNGTVTLQKKYKEKWTKKRGSAEKDMTGHTTEYFVDDVPVKQKDYKAKVAELAADDDLFRLLTHPSHFSEKLHWQKRRELLLDICGDLTDEDVINSDPELADLPTILGGKNCDDYKKIVAASRKKINTDIDGIPGRIDEVDRGKPEIETTDVSALPEVIAGLMEDLDKKNQEIATTKAGGMVAELNKKLAEVEAAIQRAKTAHEKASASAAGDMRESLSNEKEKLADLRLDLTSSNAAKATTHDVIARLRLQLDDLRGDWQEITEEVFTEESCPTCKQILPEDQVDEAFARFNKDKSSRLENNNEQGKAVAESLELHIKAATKHKEELSSIETAVAEKETEIAALTKKIHEKDGDVQDLETMPEYVELVAAKESLEKEITTEASGSDEVLEKLKSEKLDIEEKVQANEKKISLVEQAQKADERIEELKKEEKSLAEKYEELERHLFLIEKFVRAKVSMLEERINDKFSFVNFKLFAEQVNGGLQEVCEVTVDGVPYNSLNNGARVQSGLDIINTISKHHKFHPMIFVDNRESVTSLPETEAQMINLIVSEDDKTMRIANQ